MATAARKTRKVEPTTVELPEVTAPILATPIPDYTAIITADLEAFDGTATTLHEHVVDLIRHVSTLPKVGVERNEALRILLTTNTAGIDRQQVATWLEAFTPLSIKLERSGIKSLNLPASKIKARDRMGVPRWDTKGMMSTGWWTMDKAPAAPPKAVDASKVQKALGASVAKLAFELKLDNPTLEGNEALKRALHAVIDNIETIALDAAVETMGSEKFETWAKRRKDARAIERSEAANAARSEVEAKAAKRAAINEALAALAA